MWTRAWSASFSGWTSCCRRSACMARAVRMSSLARAAVPARKVTGTATPTGSNRKTPSAMSPPRHAPLPSARCHPHLHAILTRPHVRMRPHRPFMLPPPRTASVCLSVSDSMTSSLHTDCREGCQAELEVTVPREAGREGRSPHGPCMGTPCAICVSSKGRFLRPSWVSLPVRVGLLGCSGS